MESFCFELANAGDIGQITSITHSEAGLAFRPRPILQASVKKTNLLVCRDKIGGKLVGWIEKFPIFGQVWGISTLYVFPRFRNRGIGKILLDRVITQLQGKIVYTATASPAVIKVVCLRGFKAIEPGRIPKLILGMWLIRRYYHPATWKKYLSGQMPRLNYYVKYPPL